MPLLEHEQHRGSWRGHCDLQGLVAAEETAEGDVLFALTTASAEAA